MRAPFTSPFYRHDEGPIGLPSAHSHEVEVVNEVSPTCLAITYPSNQRYHHYSLRRTRLRNSSVFPETFINTFKNNHKSSTINDSSIILSPSTNHTSASLTGTKCPLNETTTRAPEDAMALLSFSRRASMETKSQASGDISVSLSSRVKKSGQISKAMTHHVSNSNLQTAEKNNNDNREKVSEGLFRYPVDFAFGMILREKVLVPLLPNGKSDDTTINEKSVSNKMWFDSLSHVDEISLARELMKFARGDKVRIVKFRKIDREKKEEKLQNLLSPDDTNRVVKRRASWSTGETCGNRKRLKHTQGSISKKILNRNMSDGDISEDMYDQNNCEHNSNGTQSFCLHSMLARIEVCSASDVVELGGWYENGEKYLSYTSKSWCGWWGEKCCNPDPSCELIKLTNSENKILGVAYYERNIVDNFKTNCRTTLIRGIRINPLYNPEVLSRSSLNQSPSDLPKLLKTIDEACHGLSATLLTAVVFRSLLCGTCCVGVNSEKNEAIESFYRKFMGSPIAFHKSDARRYYLLDGEDRFSLLRCQFNRQLNLEALSIEKEGNESSNSSDVKQITMKYKVNPEASNNDDNSSMNNDIEKVGASEETKTLDDQPCCYDRKEKEIEKENEKDVVNELFGEKIQKCGESGCDDQTSRSQETKATY